jgi:uncharacterized protein YndB with AHSA1/START domain
MLEEDSGDVRLKVEGLVDASVEAVFHARTDLDVLRRLNDHPISRVSGDLCVGGTRIIEWGPSEEKLCRVTQVFREIERLRRLVYTELLEVPPSPVYESVICESFAERDGKTLLTFRIEGFPTVEERDLHTRGYQLAFERLEKHFASSKDPSS